MIFEIQKVFSYQKINNQGYKTSLNKIIFDQTRYNLSIPLLLSKKILILT